MVIHLYCAVLCVCLLCVRAREKASVSDASLQIADRDLNVAAQQTKMNINYFNYSSEVIFKVTCSF